MSVCVHLPKLFDAFVVLLILSLYIHAISIHHIYVRGQKLQQPLQSSDTLHELVQKYLDKRGSQRVKYLVSPVNTIISEASVGTYVYICMSVCMTLLSFFSMIIRALWCLPSLPTFSER